MRITLIGYRASGKTSVARRLAERRGCAWVDADVEVERTAGRSIPDIFASDGEAEFRRIEREVLHELFSRPTSIVIATGGGAILDKATRREMKEAGPVVWLHASVEELSRRLADDADSNRPSLTDKSVVDEVAEVLAVREPLYRDAATIVVDTEGQSIDHIATAIIDQLPASDGTDVESGESIS